MTNGVGVATTIIDTALVYIYKIRVEKTKQELQFQFPNWNQEHHRSCLKDRNDKNERMWATTDSAELFHTRAVQSIALISGLTSTAKWAQGKLAVSVGMATAIVDTTLVYI